jgi:hypothetical protein
MGRGVDRHCQWERFALSWKVKVDMGLNLFHATIAFGLVEYVEIVVLILNNLKIFNIGIERLPSL